MEDHRRGVPVLEALSEAVGLDACFLLREEKNFAQRSNQAAFREKQKKVSRNGATGQRTKNNNLAYIGKATR